MSQEQTGAQNWEARYRRQSTPWDRGETSPALLSWLRQGEVPAGRIAVPGCGYGHEVITLCEHGFSVTAIDISATAIESLAKRLDASGLTAELVACDVLDYSPDTPFDGIFEQTCLCALDPALWRRYVDQLARWLKPSGILLALFMQTGKPGGPPWHCDPIAMQRLFKPPLWRWLDTSAAAIPFMETMSEYPTILQRCAQNLTASKPVA